MIPGIDPKVDVAFKKVFGSTQHTGLTMALIDAVLQPAPWQQLVELTLLNPYSEKMTLDDKVSILDIKARDERGRMFNLEMQMVPEAALAQRFLYYWAQLYLEQLEEGQSYDRLCPAISICFVNGRLFSDRRRYHRRFCLLDTEDHEYFTADQEIHLLELPNFRREVHDLPTPLDLWLYFLKNGDRLDADALPEPLTAPDVRQAMEVLRMFSQDRMERELYEGRLKARRDAQARDNETRRVQAEFARAQAELEQTQADLEQSRADLEQSRADLEQSQADLEQSQADLEQSQAEMELRAQALQHERDQARGVASNLLVQHIQMCQRMLGHDVSGSAELAQHNHSALQALAERLASEIERRS